MFVRKTLKWFFVLLTAVGLAGTGAGYWYWTRQDEVLRLEILKQLAMKAPHWDVKIGRARYDWNRRIHLWNVSLSPREGDSVLGASEMILTVDADKIRNQRKVELHKVRFVSPVVEVVRSADGRWNWEQLLPAPKGDDEDAMIPEVELEAGELKLRIEPSDGRRPVEFAFGHIDLKFVPIGRDAFEISGRTQADPAGAIKFAGSWNRVSGAWSLEGRVDEVSTTDEVWSLAADASPEFRRQLARIDGVLRRAAGESQRPELPDGSASPFQVASRRDAGDLYPTALSRPSQKTPPIPVIPDLGISGTIDVGFRISQEGAGEVPEVEAVVDVRQGKLTNPVLPFPLHDVSGRFVIRKQHVELQNVEASNGVTKLTVNGTIQRGKPAEPGLLKKGSAPLTCVATGVENAPLQRVRPLFQQPYSAEATAVVAEDAASSDAVATPMRAELNVRAVNLLLDERLRTKLTPGLKQKWDDLSPAGPVDAVVDLSFDGTGRFTYRNLRLHLKGCTARHVKFPYPITAVTGTVVQKGTDMEVDIQGMGGRRTGRCTGYVRNPGLEAEYAFDIRIDDVPIDDAVLSACQPEVRATIESLDLAGRLNVRYNIFRPLGADRTPEFQLVVHVVDGSVDYQDFPYPLRRFSGIARYDSVTKLWKFQDLSAVHGAARITAAGSYQQNRAPWMLDLDVEAENVPLDDTLRGALPADLKIIWDDVSPRGFASATTKVRWNVGSAPSIDLPEIEMRDGSFKLACVPYPLSNVAAKAAFTDGLVALHSFSGTHGRTVVAGRGAVEYNQAGDWRVTLNSIGARDLVPDSRFRQALPDDLKSFMDEVDPHGLLDVEGAIVLRGTTSPDDPVTAAWRMAVTFKGGSLALGVDAKNIRGTVRTAGHWDGRNLTMGAGNRVDLETIEVLDYKIANVKGPFQLRNNRLIAGSRKVFEKRDPAVQPVAIPNGERIIATAVGGTITLDVAADFNALEPEYHVKLTLTEGLLEEYARLYMPDTEGMRGLMNGWIDLYGRGTSTDLMAGRGQVRVAPAELYELPVIVQMFDVLSLGSGDRTAFRYAFADFNVRNNQFLFNQIDLVGESVDLRGRGNAGFNGSLDLQFYSQLPRNRLPIPILRELVGEATKGWVGVTVAGSVDSPVATYKAAPQVDDAMKRFLGRITPGGSRGVPRIQPTPLPFQSQRQRTTERRAPWYALP